jgi:hypothetical protein
MRLRVVPSAEAVQKLFYTIDLLLTNDKKS